MRVVLASDLKRKNIKASFSPLQQSVRRVYHLNIAKELDALAPYTRSEIAQLHIELCAPGMKSALEAFLKAMYAVNGTYLNLTMPDQTYKALKRWVGEAGPFIQTFGIKPTGIFKAAELVRDAKFDDLNEKVRDAYENQVLSIGKAAAKSLGKLDKTPEVPSDLISMLKSLLKWMWHGHDNHLYKIEQNAKKMGDPDLTVMFMPQKVATQKNLLPTLKNIVRSLVGQETPDGYKVPFTKLNEAKAKKPAMFKQYQELRKEALKLYKDFLLIAVTKSGKIAVPVAEIRKQAESRGIYVNSLPPKSYTGYIGADGSLYSLPQEGKKITPTPGWGDEAIYEMNPNYDPQVENYYFKCQMPQPNGGTMGNWGRYYTEEHWKGSSQKIEKITLDLSQGGKVFKIRKRWTQDLVKGVGINAVLALMCEVLWQTTPRIGGEGGNTAGEKTYGLSVWRMNQVKMQGNTVKIKYIGKSGVQQTHMIRGSDMASRAAIKMLKQVMADKILSGDMRDYEREEEKEGREAATMGMGLDSGLAADPYAPRKKKKAQAAEAGVRPKRGTDFLFTYEGQPVKAFKVSRYLTSIGMPAGGSVHKLRHAAADLLARKQIAKANLKRGTELKEADEWYRKNVATPVAIQLGHKNAEGEPLWSTCVKSYIPISTTKEYFDKLGTRYPKWLESLLKRKGKI